MHMIRRSLLLAVAAVAPLGAQVTQQAAVHRSALHDYRIVKVAEGFVNPWSIAFLPSGEILVTERAGRLRVIRNGQLAPEPVAGLPKIRVAGQGGLRR